MIAGERVTLRAVEREDIPFLHAAHNDIEVELAGGGDPPYPQSLARAYAEFDSQSGQGGRDGSSFAIEADGRIIGTCALFNRDDIARTAELGITIGDKAYWGRGYGSEAIALLVGYGHEKLNLRRIWLRVHGRNERAIRAYAAAGFIEEGRQRDHVWSDGAYDDLVLMAHTRHDASGQ